MFGFLRPVAHVPCGNYRTTLMYPYGAPSVKYVVYHYITNINVMRSGIPNFCAVALALGDLGYKAVGIRLDFGDLAYLSCHARKFFCSIENEFGVPGFGKLIITASNDLNEETLDALNKQVCGLEFSIAPNPTIKGQNFIPSKGGHWDIMSLEHQSCSDILIKFIGGKIVVKEGNNDCGSCHSQRNNLDLAKHLIIPSVNSF
ncbi:nicotinate phosphoribosyltransferase [Trifolium repens]|nr:nicotinate phosphoribosyltransferase [Trifolium repens]